MRIGIRKASGWDGLDLVPYALDEVKAASNGKFTPATRMYLVTLEERPMFLVGIRPTTMAGTGAEVWLMLCRDATVHMRHYISFLYRGMRHLCRTYGGLQAAVRDDFWAGHRFAKFLGFKPRSQVVAVDGAVYVVYEVRQWEWR